MEEAPVIEARGITRVYPGPGGGVVANDAVDLTVRPGTVHAVVGENGAGKSTLMKILFGVERPDAGTLRIGGEAVALQGPRDAIARGVGMVFQHFSLVPSFTAAENVVLGAEPRQGPMLARAEARARVAALSERFRLRVDPDAPVRTLPVGQQQRVEILKALYRDARILILDEPTAVLAPQEVEELFAAVRALTAQGRTVLFIAHKLPEVLAISDRVTVMRGGRTVGEVARADTDESRLAALMVGRDVALGVERAGRAGPEALRVENLRLVSDRGAVLAEGLSLAVRSGEILGLAAVEGNGQAELIEAVAGLRPVASGAIRLGSEDLIPLDVAARRARGVAHIPEDRLARGLAPGATVAENLAATRLADPRLVRRGLLDRAAIRDGARALIDRFAIRVGGPDAAVGTLSGGNMQKVVVARELAEAPRLLLVNQPTRGVDLGATQFIWSALTAARDGGAAVLLASADLQELLALSDRLLVLYRGRVVAAFRNGPGVTPERLGRHMLGIEEQDAGAMREALA